MMYAWGDVRWPLAETALAIEKIVQEQMIEMVSYMRNSPQTLSPSF